MKYIWYLVFDSVLLFGTEKGAIYLYKMLTLTDTQCWHLTTYLVPTINVVLYFGNMVENKDTQVIKWLFNCPFSDFTL